MNCKKVSCFLLLLSTAVLFIVMTTGIAQAQSYVVEQDFTLVNHTGETIVYVLKHNQEIDIVFSPWDDAQYWDVRAEFDDGTYEEWYKFDLFTVSEITLNRDGTASYR